MVQDADRENEVEALRPERQHSDIGLRDPYVRPIQKVAVSGFDGEAQIHPYDVGAPSACNICKAPGAHAGVQHELSAQFLESIRSDPGRRTTPEAFRPSRSLIGWVSVWDFGFCNGCPRGCGGIIAQIAQGVAREPIRPPAVHRDGAESRVKADRGFVPGQDASFQRPTPGRPRSARAEREEPSRSEAAALRLHVQVFEVEARAREPRRVVVEKEREADDLSRRSRPGSPRRKASVRRGDLRGGALPHGSPRVGARRERGPR